MSDDLAITASIQSGNVPPSISANIWRRVATSCCGFISRWSVSRLGVDDAFAGFSMLLQVAFIALAGFLIDLGTGRHLQYIEYVLTPSQTEKSEVLNFSAHLIYTTALFVCRLSGLAFYRRLCELHETLELDDIPTSRRLNNAHAEWEPGIGKSSLQDRIKGAKPKAVEALARQKLTVLEELALKDWCNNWKLGGFLRGSRHYVEWLQICLHQ
ncbi:hypothetical protein OIDMADRAFT_178902 [Oidiodendron maius Zn]|uniref:Rhodopsin domain-containing protein n=1 Tax=Oidiodendron maius (strain Zn) TaxID=913774 RepID=A0A0C3HLR5_OIDMZ|nr:hypothetical protein OIDMADRAFT_178902 [Oidiodendron maius Zn]